MPQGACRDIAQTSWLHLTHTSTLRFPQLIEKATRTASYSKSWRFVRTRSLTSSRRSFLAPRRSPLCSRLPHPVREPATPWRRTEFQCTRCSVGAKNGFTTRASWSKSGRRSPHRPVTAPPAQGRSRGCGAPRRPRPLPRRSARRGSTGSPCGSASSPPTPWRRSPGSAQRTERCTRALPASLRRTSSPAPSDPPARMFDSCSRAHPRPHPRDRAGAQLQG